MIEIWSLWQQKCLPTHDRLTDKTSLFSVTNTKTYQDYLKNQLHQGAINTGQRSIMQVHQNYNTISLCPYTTQNTLNFIQRPNSALPLGRIFQRKEQSLNNGFVILPTICQSPFKEYDSSTIFISSFLMTEVNAACSFI